MKDMKMGKMNCGTGWLFAALAAIGLAVALVTGIGADRRLDAARGLPSRSSHGSSALGKTRLPKVSAEARTREEARIRAERDKVVEAYLSAVKAEYEAFQRRVAERAMGFDTVRAGVPSLVDKYGFVKCWDLMYALAKDEIARTFGRGSTTNFDELMNADLRDGFYQPIQDARGEVLVLLNELQARLSACRGQLSDKLARLPAGTRVSVSRLRR